MFPVDRNGANCSKPVKLAAAEKLSHDDYPQCEPLLLLSPHVGVRIGERQQRSGQSIAQTHPKPHGVGFLVCSRLIDKVKLKERKRKETNVAPHQ
jgi:hypothetical protein